MAMHYRGLWYKTHFAKCYHFKLPKFAEIPISTSREFSIVSAEKGLTPKNIADSNSRALDSFKKLVRFFQNKKIFTDF